MGHSSSRTPPGDHIPHQETTFIYQETTSPHQETTFIYQETTYPHQETTFIYQETTSPHQETTFIYPTTTMADEQQQQFCLRWNDYQTTMVENFKNLRNDKSFSDVTIVCEGQNTKAHKMLLCACSPYFKNPIIFLKDVPFQ